MRFAREGAPFAAPPAVLAGLLFFFRLPLPAAICVVLAVLLLLFFRIPSYELPSDKNLVVAPAYGRITRVDSIEEPSVGEGSVTRIVTFLSVFDVHVQRSPAAGVVEMRRFASGRKVAAFRGDAAEINESEMSVLRTDAGERIGVRQVVGLLARRIVCYLGENDRVARGDLIGLIKFGSRVDLLIPPAWEVLVEPGDRVRGGETPMARPVPLSTEIS